MLSSLRVKFGLLTIASVLLATFAWNTAQGQMRPPRPIGPPRLNPGVRPPGGMNPPGGIGIGWRCTKCGYTGAGAIPPRTCPSCGVTFVNGVGNGGGGLIGNPAGGRPMNPGFQPPIAAPNPPINMPVAPPTNPPPAFNLPPNTNNVPVAEPSNASDDVSSSDSSNISSRKIVMIALGIGFVVIGISVLLGGTCLVVYTLRNRISSSERRPRRRRIDYDD